MNCDREALYDVIIDFFTEDGSREAKRDQAKAFYIALMYNSSFKTWEESCRTPKFKKRWKLQLKEHIEEPPIATAFKTEMVAVSQKLQGLNPTMVGAIKKHGLKKRNTYHDGTFLSYYLQEWERRVLEVCVSAVTETYGQVVRVLCYDGFMMDKRVSAARVIALCSKKVREKLSLELTFTEKEMPKGLLTDVEEVEQKLVDGSYFPKETIREFDHSYANELSSYPVVKAYMEKFLCKVRKGCKFLWTTLRYETDQFGTTTSKYDVYIFQKSELANAYEDIITTVINPKTGKSHEEGFPRVWFPEPKKNVYNNLVFEPYNGLFMYKQPSKNFNLFTGYNPFIEAKVDPEIDREALLEPFMDVGLHLFGGNKAFFHFFLQCIAFKIQYPAKKLPYCFIVFGPQGIGKDTLMGIIGNIVGQAHYYNTATFNDLFGKHAEGFKQRIFVVYNEGNQGDTLKHAGQIKSAITDLWLTVNAKNEKPYIIKNVAFLTILSNQLNAVQVDMKSGDRRFLAAEGDHKYADTKQFPGKFQYFQLYI